MSLFQHLICVPLLNLTDFNLFGALFWRIFKPFKNAVSRKLF